MGRGDKDVKDITNAPAIFNKDRMDRAYSTNEALTVLKKSQLLSDSLYLTEEIIAGFGTFSSQGRTCLQNALRVGNDDECHAGVYTCEPYSFTVGHSNGSYYAIDTHPVGKECMGDGSALVIVFHDQCIVDRLDELCRWIWQRLAHGSTKCDSMQSFSKLELPEHIRYVFNR